MPTLHRWLAQVSPIVRRWATTASEQARRVSVRAGVLTAGLRDRARALDRRYVAAGAGLVLAGGLAIVVDTVAGAPGAQEIRAIGQMPVATVVLDRHDKPAFTIFRERRHEIPLDAVSPHLRNAVLAIEDMRFYKHRGIDLWRIAGSMWANVQSGEFAQGGSTITQQLARLSFLTPDKQVRRKLKEMYLAMRIEQVYTKDEILEMYLNKVYLGSGLHGVEAAARGYFDKSAADLTIDEAALIAGLIQSPSSYDPAAYLSRAVNRRATVLNRMAAEGMISPDEAKALAARPVTLAQNENRAVGAWFKQAVTRELVDRFGWETVSQDGLRVYTTYDPAAQKAAEVALAEGLARIEERSTFRHRSRAEVPKPEDGSAPDYLQGALVAIDPTSGEVRALVGGRDFSESQFDRVQQAARQSGSAFKPFVYAAALEQGLSPATLITRLDQPIQTPEGPWLPDDGHNAASALTVRAALRTSSNRAAAQLLQTIGIKPAVDQARRLGLDAPPVPSLVLGTGDVTLMALTAAYGAFADSGRLHAPHLIRRIEDAEGKVLFEAKDEVHRVISEQTAFQMAAMLADVVERGTGVSARQTGFRLRAAGKTGTTNDYRDAWFVGFTPELVAGVWVGFDRPRTIVPGGYASELAVPIWGNFMRDATAGARDRWIERPSNVVLVEVCQESGLLPTAACRRVRRVSSNGTESFVSMVGAEYFQHGTEPHAYCPLHELPWMPGVRAAAEPGAFPSAGGVATLSAPAERARGETPAVAAAEEAAPPEVQPERRRGFWSRVAGVFRGGNNNRDRQDEPDDDK